MIRFILDAVILLAVSVAAGMRAPFLGVVFLGVSMSYVSQYWRVVHLLGYEEHRPDRRRILMALVLALIFGAGGFLILGVPTPSAPETNATRLWQEDFIPIWVGMGFFASLSLIYLANERRKR